MSTLSTLRRNVANRLDKTADLLATKGWRKGLASDADPSLETTFPLPVDMAIGHNVRGGSTYLGCIALMSQVAGRRGFRSLVAYNDQCKDKRLIIRDLRRTAVAVRRGDHDVDLMLASAIAPRNTDEMAGFDLGSWHAAYVTIGASGAEVREAVNV